MTPAKLTCPHAKYDSQMHIQCEKTGDLHKWETTVIEPATETDSGELKYTCSDCGAEKTGYIPRIEGFALAKNT